MEALLELPTHIRARMASALESGLLPLPATEAAVQSVLGAGDDAPAVLEALANLSEVRLTPQQASFVLKVIDKTVSLVPHPDLVWTGPKVRGIHARSTRRVYEELISGARESLWVSTYAFFDGPRAFARLARRMETFPELEVTILLNIQRRRGDTSAPEELIRAFAERFWRQEWPGSRRPRVYFDPRSVEPESTGVLHAKAVIADREKIFVTSANLTDAALDDNLELGLLARDRALAASAETYLRALIERELLHVLPSA